ncbi:hypothetical protein BpHYR1_036199 [Brachionus plicatilis]|uniref:Uncharacterized protein n=1 Tax=Brachionus plicatilis TaxID=10195 RepID=A0A3M7RK92_BRAPC|nr:hypothetical protein BpHYR1_036199 [Brachionus plicatilis]
MTSGTCVSNRTHESITCIKSMIHFFGFKIFFHVTLSYKQENEIKSVLKCSAQYFLKIAKQKA